MSRDFRQWWIDDDADVGGDVPRRPPPGKVTLTQSIPVQRRARPNARPAEKTPPIQPFGFVQAYGGDVKEPASASFPDEQPVSWLAADADQACRAAFDFEFKPVQRAAAAAADSDTSTVHAAAAKGVESPSQQLPHIDQIQKSFGKHDVSHVQAHVGGAAAEASAAMGAEAYATGNHVAFDRTPNLHTAAHEAAHVVQQQRGVQLKGGVGEAGDAYERHADAVADKVVAGESAEALLDEMAGTIIVSAQNAGAVQRKKGERGDTQPPKAATAIAEAANDVSLAAGLASAAVTDKAHPEAHLVQLDAALEALGRVLHERAGDRSPTDAKAVRAALRAASQVADAMSRRHSSRDKAEADLRRKILDVERLAFTDEGAPRGPADLKPAELEAQAAISLEQLEAARDLAATMAIAAPSLDHTIEKTEGWRDTLAAPEATTEDARRLSNAVFQQQEILFELTSELNAVVAEPSPANYEIIEAYVVAMSKSTETRSVANTFHERARRKKRAQPLARAGATLGGDYSTSNELAELDAKAGAKAKHENEALAGRQQELSNTLAHGGKVSDYQIRKLEVDSREQAIRHHTQVLELQGRQLVAALSELSGTGSNAFDEELAWLLGYLRVEVEYFPVLWERHKRNVAEAEDVHGADAEGPWRILRSRDDALNELEASLQKRLAQSKFLETLRRASKKAESAQARVFATQLIATIALTLAGNFAASAARGAAEGAWLARATPVGATEAEVAAVAARAEAVGSAAAFGADLAVNTIGQKLQGDGASLLTLLTLNLVSPLILGKLQKNFVALEKINASAALWKRAGSAVIHFAYDKLALSIEMIGGAAVDYASRLLLGAQAQDPTEQEAESWLYQGAAMALGRHLSVRSRTVAHMLEKLQTQSRRSMHDLIARSNGLESDAVRLSATGDLVTAQNLLDVYEKILSDRAAIPTETHDVAPRDKHPSDPGDGDANGITHTPGAGGKPIEPGHTKPGHDGGQHPDSAPASEKLDKRLNQIDDSLYTADSRALTHIRDTWEEHAPGAKVGKIEYDPHTDQAHFEVVEGGKRVFVTANVPPRVMSTAELATASNRVVGEPFRSANDGRRLLRDLNAGHMQALGKVGMDVPADFQLHRPTEFGLGQLADGRFVLVIGVRDNVDWNRVPGLKPVAHGHPATEGNNLQKLFGTERIPFAKIFEKTEAPLMVREIMVPSPSDARIMARRRVDGHRVLTEFVVHDGFVSNAKPGDDSPRVEWVIRNPREIGETPDGYAVFEWVLVAEVGGARIARKHIWSIEPKHLGYESDGSKPNADLGSHLMSRPELMPKGTSTKLDGPEEATTRAPSVGTEGHGLDPVKLLPSVAERTGVTADKITINGDASFDHVSVRPVGDSLEIHFKPGTSEASIMEAVDAHLRLSARRPKDLMDPYVAGPRGGKRRWTGADEAAYQGRPLAEQGYAWELHKGKLRYVREGADVADGDENRPQQKRAYDEASGKLVDTPEQSGDDVFEARTKAEAFEELGGNDPSREFGAWVTAVETHLGIGRDQLIALMTDPRDAKGAPKNHRSVRSPLKKQITASLVETITDETRLRARYPDVFAHVDSSDSGALRKAHRAASHKAMLEATAGLGSGDRGSIAEQWYVKMYASPEALTHVRFSKNEMAKQGVILTKDRVPDIIDDKKLQDVKHVSGALDADARTQLDEFALLVRRSLVVDGRTISLETMAVVFTEPAGGAANAEYIARLVAAREWMTVEIYSNRGERKIITSSDRGRSSFNTIGGPEGLARAIREFTTGARQ